MPTIRPYDADDLGRVRALWREASVDVDVDDALQVIGSDGAVALVADVGGSVGGVALEVLSDREGRIVDVTTASGDVEVADSLLDASLVAASELFTPADIEFAARKAAQRAFEREHFGGAAYRARTDDFLAAIAATRPSLSEEIVASFDEDVREFARD